MPQAIIFDVDGTLVDSVDLHARSWQEALRRFGHDAPFAEVRRQIGKGGDELMKAFLSPGEIERRGEEIEAWRGERFKAEYMPQVRPFPRVRELFEHILARGQRIGLGTSGKPDELEHHEALLGIGDLDLAATTSDDADRSKPHPDIVQAVLGKLGVAPGEAAMVGDTPYDAIAAGRAGVAAVGVLCGGFPADELRRAGCAALFQDPADLLARYDESLLARR